MNVMIDHVDEDIRKSILTSIYDKPKKDQFKVFHFLYQKKYDLNSEEGLMRYKIFKTNLKYIQESNSKNLSYKLGLNHFADLIDEEFKKGFMIPIEKMKEQMKQFLKTPEAEEKKKNFDLIADKDEALINKTNSQKEQVRQQIRVNWTSKMNPARDQAFCGSCWAFSTIASVEGNYNIKFGNSPNFSEQELVDCDYRNTNCIGGFPEKALDYIKQYGLAYGNEYPYISGATNQKDICRSSFTSRNMIIEDYEHCPLGNCSKTQLYSMLQRGPVIVAMDGDGGTESAKMFRFYTSGILENMPCKMMTHALVLVGSDYDSNGQYLIGRNSWGPGWGDRGTFMIRGNPNDNTCFMESYGVLPIVKNTSNPVPLPPTLGCLKIYSECDLKGNVKEICENTPNIENFPIIAGFEIGKFRNVKLYTNNYTCTGAPFILDQSVSCFATYGLPHLVNNIKSIIVNEQKPPNGCIWVFSQNCISGEKLEICNNVPDLNAFNFGNKISSITLGPGVASITVFLDSNYQGNNAFISGDIHGLADTWMDKDIESIIITK
jgi:hypothetical protein